MNKKVSKNLIDRLVCAKYLYNKGVEMLNSKTHYASGLAVNNFQDAAELVLRVIAEHHHVSLKSNVAFNQIIDSIDEKADSIGISRLTHRSNLNQLNNTRVNFKHFAIRPDLEDARKFAQDLASFFPIAFKNFLGLDFETLSLVQLITQTRTKNWLKRAEKYLNESKYPESSACSRIAFEIHRKYNPSRSLWGWRNDKDIKSELDSRDIKNGAFFKLAGKADERINKIKAHVDILFDGIDPPSYKKLIAHTPDVEFSMKNEIVSPDFEEDSNLNNWYIEQLPEFTPGVANFCFRFALDSILKLQEQSIPPRYQRPKPQIEYIVINDTTIYVSPSKKEILKKVEEGTILDCYELAEKHNTEGFIAIYDENMTAYVPKDSVEKIEEEAK